MELPQNLLQSFACVASEKNFLPKMELPQNFLQIFSCKVWTFWETHKIWKNLPYGFDKSADLLSKRQNHKADFFKLCVLFKKSELYKERTHAKVKKRKMEISQNLVAFSEYMNFTIVS